MRARACEQTAFIGYSADFTRQPSKTGLLSRIWMLTLFYGITHISQPTLPTNKKGKFSFKLGDFVKIRFFSFQECLTFKIV
jgi:hypothetical protein